MYLITLFCFIPFPFYQSLVGSHTHFDHLEVSTLATGTLPGLLYLIQLHVYTLLCSLLSLLIHQISLTSLPSRHLSCSSSPSSHPLLPFFPPHPYSFPHSLSPPLSSHLAPSLLPPPFLPSPLILFSSPPLLFLFLPSSSLFFLPFLLLLFHSSHNSSVPSCPSAA